MDGWMDGWMGRCIDGQTDDECTILDVITL